MNFNEVIHQLFLALDSTVEEELYNYHAGLVDYPSKLSIKALRDYCEMFPTLNSKALEMIREEGGL